LAATEPEAGRDNHDEREEQLAGGQLALARSRAYGLLSQLYLAGVTAQNLAQVQAASELASQLASPFDADEAAADHHTLFSFNVHPYQSYFLDPAGLLGGPVTESVAQTYHSLGFEADLSGQSADHIGLELGFLAFLCVAEAEALADERPQMADQLTSRQLAFMLDHLLPWIGPLTLAISQQGQRFYSALATVTLDLVQEHAAEVSTRLKRPLAGETSLPQAPAILEDEATGLKEIAEFLLTPAYSGIYLSRDDIGRLARRHAVPRGFGDRRQLLHNLLRSAANYEALGDVIDNLEELTGRWLAGYDGMIAQGEIGVFVAGWRARAGSTAAMLQRMRGRIEALS
jgi:TorA maturation chaperone TorD